MCDDGNLFIRCFPTHLFTGIKKVFSGVDPVGLVIVSVLKDIPVLVRIFRHRLGAERHRVAMERSVISLQTVRSMVADADLTPEIAAEELRAAIMALESLVGRVDVEQPIHISNVLPVNPKTSRGTRVRFQVNSDGTKKRLALDGTELGVVKQGGH